MKLGHTIKDIVLNNYKEIFQMNTNSNIVQINQNIVQKCVLIRVWLG